jgi:hypothetical protein
MKAKNNDTVRIEDLNSHQIKEYILQQPRTEYRPLFVNSHQRRRYEEITHYDSKVQGDILYTNSPLGKLTIGKSEGDIVEVSVKGNISSYKILEIKR